MSLERTLHHFPLDPASRQVRLVLGEKRLAFTEVQVRYWERPKELTALNPSGMVPVLVEADGDDRLVLCEARAILDHLEETVPEPALLGREPGRARRRRGAGSPGSTASSSMRPAAISAPRRWKSGCWAWARRTSPTCARAS